MKGSTMSRKIPHYQEIADLEFEARPGGRDWDYEWDPGLNEVDKPPFPDLAPPETPDGAFSLPFWAAVAIGVGVATLAVVLIAGG